MSLVGNNGRVAINRQVSSFVFIFIHSSFNLASENIHFQQTQTERCFTNFFFFLHKNVLFKYKITFFLKLSKQERKRELRLYQHNVTLPLILPLAHVQQAV